MTMREIARQCAIPESTLRVWRDEFEAFLPAEGEGKRRRYSEATQEQLVTLVEWKKVGMPSEQIRSELVRRAAPQEKQRRRTTETQLEELLGLVRAQASELAALRAEVGELRRQLGQQRQPVRFDNA